MGSGLHQQHGYIAAAKTRTFRAGVQWLQRQAQRLYPASRYVRGLPPVQWVLDGRPVG
jgi:hypothetical protein